MGGRGWDEVGLGVSTGADKEKLLPVFGVSGGEGGRSGTKARAERGILLYILGSGGPEPSDRC